MKKLKLKALELGSSELLQREQLRKIIGGGYEDGRPCYYNCQMLEVYANGTSSSYTVEISSVDTDSYARNYATSVVKSGYAKSCSYSCDTSVPCHS